MKVDPGLAEEVRAAKTEVKGLGGQAKAVAVMEGAARGGVDWVRGWEGWDSEGWDSGAAGLEGRVMAAEAVAAEGTGSRRTRLGREPSKHCLHCSCRRTTTQGPEPRKSQQLLILPADRCLARTCFCSERSPTDIRLMMCRSLWSLWRC